MADEIFNIALEDKDYQEVEAKKELSEILSKLEEIAGSLKGIEQYQVPTLPTSVKVSNLNQIPKPVLYSPLHEEIVTELNQIKHFLRRSMVKPEEKQEEELTFVVDKYSSKVTYVGHAKVGSDEKEEVWKIKKITDEKEEVSCQYADGDIQFDNSWSKRTSLEYA